jgi:hypothetical protein
MRQCNDAYADLCKLLDESRIAVWTTAHDRLQPINDDDRERTKGSDRMLPPHPPAACLELICAMKASASG